MLKSAGELKNQLGKSGSLSVVLKPEDFAPEGAVADILAFDFKDKLKPTQTRRIFHTIKQIENTTRKESDENLLGEGDRMRLTLLGPELAYAAGRELIPREFYELLKLMLATEKMKTVGDLRRLVQFLTAIVAYQKYHSKN